MKIKINNIEYPHLWIEIFKEEVSLVGSHKNDFLKFPKEFCLEISVDNKIFVDKIANVKKQKNIYLILKTSEDLLAQVRQAKEASFTYPDNFERDYEFYFSISDIFTSYLKNDSFIVFDLDGVSAKRAFYERESCGQFFETYEDELLRKLYTTKSSFILQLKMWAEGVANKLFFSFEIYEELEKINAPSWAYDSFRKNAYKSGWLNE